jgi:hypothetical protein
VEGGGCLRRGGGSLGRDATGVLGEASPEAVGEAAGDGLEVTHASGSGGLSPLGLLGPVVLADLSGGVSTRRTGALLNVEGAASTTTAQGVRLVVALSEGSSSLGHVGRC